MSLPPCSHHTPSLARWSDLPDDLLHRIFTIVCSRDGNTTPQPSIPLTCQRWREAYIKCPQLWRNLSLDWAPVLFSPDTPSHTPVSRYGFAGKWVEARAPLLRTLVFSNCYVLGPALDFNLLSPLCAKAKFLESIHLSGLRGSADDAIIAVCQGAMAGAGATSTSRLRSIKISYDQPKDGRTHPLRVSVSALKYLSLLSSSLECIDLAIDAITPTGPPTADLAPFWSKLRKLKTLRIHARMHSVVIDPELLLALPSLHHLDLTNVRLPQFSPAMVSTLSRLTHISLHSVLAARPRRKSGFTLWDALSGFQSLTHVRVSGVGGDAGLPASALAIPGLRSLHITDCVHVGTWPSKNALLCAGASGGGGDLYPGIASLEELVVAEVGIGELPPPLLWSRLRCVTSLTWRNVHYAASRHRYWDHRGPCALPPDAVPLMRRLNTLRFEYSGLHAEALKQTMEGVLRHATNVRELSLEGNRFDRGKMGEGVHDMVAVQRLSLVNCGLTSVPREVYCLHALEELDLRDNPRLVDEVGVGMVAGGSGVEGRVLRVEGEGKQDAAAPKIVHRNDRHALLQASLPRLPSMNDPSVPMTCV